LRAKNQITEIRLLDLRFEEEETRHYLGQSTGESLAADLVAELHQRAEGWILGLRLAILAMPRIVRLLKKAP
jgi:LuxR family maltose regulon positive regulatory protein